MQYMLLIYQREADLEGWSDADKTALYQAYGPFTQGLAQSGHLRAGAGLQPVATATTVRVRDGKTLTTDGPFAETKEQLGGFYLIVLPHATNEPERRFLASRLAEAETKSDH